MPASREGSGEVGIVDRRCDDERLDGRVLRSVFEGGGCTRGERVDIGSCSFGASEVFACYLGSVWDAVFKMGEMREMGEMSPIVILVRPQLGENIGMSARAMGNCGLSALRIVSPRDGWPSPSALSAARGAVAIVEGAEIFESVGDAVSDCVRVMATSARRHFLDGGVSDMRARGLERVCFAGRSGFGEWTRQSCNRVASQKGRFGVVGRQRGQSCVRC